MSNKKKTDRIISIDCKDVRFTHSKIRPIFTGCGKRIEETLTEIREGVTMVSDLPLITVIEGADGLLFSLNNRRLYVLKQLRQEGLLVDNQVQVRIKPALARELQRYTKERCSLSASIMKEHNHNQLNKEEKKPDKKIEIEIEEDEDRDGVPLSVFTGSEDTLKKSEKGRDQEKKNTNPSKLPAIVQKAWKGLQKDVTKGGNGRKKVLGQLDEWCDHGIIDDLQRTFCEASLFVS